MLKIYGNSLKSDETLSNQKEFLENFPDAKDFIEKFGGYCVYIKKENDNFEIKLFSDNYEYIMVFIKDTNYCGGFLNCRKMGVMETWTRGSDMIDGHDIKHVLREFEIEILKHELIYIGETSLVEEQCIEEEEVVEDVKN